MLYFIERFRAFAPCLYCLRTCIKLASPVRNVPAPISSSVISLSKFFFFFCFFLPICISPPYNYILSYRARYINTFFFFLCSYLQIIFLCIYYLQNFNYFSACSSFICFNAEPCILNTLLLYFSIFWL